MILALFEDSQDGGPNTVVDREAGLRWSLLEADAAPGAVLAHAVDLSGAADWVMRHDRVDFEPGGVAYRHTHPGPGIRRLVAGSVTIDSEGEETTYGPGGAWFESGPEPVLATTSPDEPSAFVRVMLLPAEWAGRRTIHYVDPADAERPRRQRATILSERPVVT